MIRNRPVNRINESVCDLDESSYIVPSFKRGNSFLDLGDIHNFRLEANEEEEDDEDDEDEYGEYEDGTNDINDTILSGSKKDKTNMPVHSSCDRLEKIEELIKQQDIQNILSDRVICRNCGYNVVKYTDKLVKFHRSTYQLLSFETHKQESRRLLSSSSSPSSSSSNRLVSKSESIAQLQTLMDTLKLIESDINQIKVLSEDAEKQRKELSSTVYHENQRIDAIESAMEVLEDDTNRVLSIAQQSFDEIGYISRLKLIHAKPLFHISETNQDYLSQVSPTSSSSSSRKPLTFLGKTYAINGFRLRFEPTIDIQLNWIEINSAWSCFATLIVCLRNRGGLSDVIINSSNTSKSLSKRGRRRTINGIRIVPLRERAILTIYGNQVDDNNEVIRNDNRSVIETIPLEGSFQVEKNGKFDIMSIKMKTYRRAVLMTCLCVAITHVELYGTSSKLPDLLLYLHKAAKEEKLDLAMDLEDDWDDSIPTGGLLEYREGWITPESQNIFYDFDSITSNQFQSLIQYTMLILKESV